MTFDTKTSHLNDQFEVRYKAAWFVAGADAFLGHAFLGTLALGATLALVATVFDLDAVMVLSVFIGAEWLLLLSIGAYLRLRSRTIAQNETVHVDRF